MRRNFFLILLFTVIIGIQPALAQSKNDPPARKTVPEKPVKEEETVIYINLASDDEFTDALETASDIELIDEDTAKNKNSGKNTNQEKNK